MKQIADSGVKSCFFRHLVFCDVFAVFSPDFDKMCTCKITYPIFSHLTKIIYEDG